MGLVRPNHWPRRIASAVSIGANVPDGVGVGGERIASKVVIWTAGSSAFASREMAERGDEPRRAASAFRLVRTKNIS